MAVLVRSILGRKSDKRGLVPQLLGQLLRLALEEEVPVRIAHKHRASHPRPQPLHGVLLDLPLELGHGPDLERPQAVGRAPALLDRPRAVDEERAEARPVEAPEPPSRRDDLGGAEVEQAVVADHGREPVLGGRGARAEDAAEGHAQQRDARRVDAGLRLDEVHDRGDDLLPPGDEAQALPAAHAALAGPLEAGDVVPALERREPVLVEGLLGARVEADVEEEGRAAPALAAGGGARAEPVDGHLEAGGGEEPPLPRDRQVGDGLGEAGDVLVPVGVDPRVVPVPVEEELGVAEVGCGAEEGVAKGHGILDDLLARVEERPLCSVVPGLGP